MAKRIKAIGKTAVRIRASGPKAERVEPAEVAVALGAEIIGRRQSADVSPITLGHLGSAILSRLRSTGGRPSLSDARQRYKVPLSDNDIARLEQIAASIEDATGTRPSLGQVASVIIRERVRAMGGGRSRSKRRDSARRRSRG
jgi:hypothetical protein